MSIVQRIKKIFYPFLFTEKVIYVNTERTLVGKTVIVAGATGGVGREIAHVFMKKGASLVLVGRIKKTLEDMAHGLDKKRILIAPADITQEEDCQRVVRETMKKFGRIDVLVNTAALFLYESIEDMSKKEWEEKMTTNVTGVFLMSQAVIPTMKKQQDGLIVNLGSKISHNTDIAPRRTLYATSKYAVEGFSTALAKEVAADGIRVTCLMPGTLRTFLSLKAHELLSPVRVAQIIAFIAELTDVQFESMIFISKEQSQ